MKYADADLVANRLAHDPSVSQLASAYHIALESLFRIATGTSSPEGTARHALKQLGIFSPARAIDMGHLMGYLPDEARDILRTETQEPRPCPHSDGTYRIPTPRIRHMPVGPAPFPYGAGDP